MVRLRLLVQDIAGDGDAFQFLMVRLRPCLQLAYVSQIVSFQFLMVRLRRLFAACLCVANRIFQFLMVRLRPMKSWE